MIEALVLRQAHHRREISRLVLFAALLVVGHPLPAQQLDSLLVEVLRPHHDRLDSMVRRREIRALVHWSKTDYFIDRGRQLGIAAELARDFEQFLNRELKTGRKPVRVVVVPVSRDKLVDYLVEGRGDISFTGMRGTPELQGRVAFSVPMFDNITEIIMRARSAPAITGEHDLAGKTVHLRPSSKYMSTLHSVNTRLRARGLPEARIAPLSEHLADADILEIMDAGLIAYTILDSYRGDFWAGIFPNIVAEDAHPLAEHLPLCLMLRTGTPRLKALLDRFITTHRVGTAYGNTLVRRYFKTNPWARRSLGKAEQARFHEMIELFRRYGSRYGFDPLMLTAQGFQESGLDQKLRSHRGAVGVMQVLPATGRALKVGDIEKLEPNIHAGAKYMHQLASTYFNEPGIDSLNRTLFCFAAYNAGPARIARFRKQAALRGLDPTLWFDNVEILAMEQGFRETVQYIVNITKYYVAYKLLEEESLMRARARDTLEKGRH